MLANDAICLGPFVLAGGEVAAMAVIDAVARRLPGALGNAESLADESFSEALGGGIEHPHYTRPADFRGQCGARRCCCRATTAPSHAGAPSGSCPPGS